VLPIVPLLPLLPQNARFKQPLLTRESDLLFFCHSCLSLYHQISTQLQIATIDLTSQKIEIL
jgi:hypothetical protein